MGLSMGNFIRHFFLSIVIADEVYSAPIVRVCVIFYSDVWSANQFSLGFHGEPDRLESYRNHCILEKVNVKSCGAEI